jgi:hypothetical protein
MNQCTHHPWEMDGAMSVHLASGFGGGMLDTALARAWPVERQTPFTELLLAIDHAERRGGRGARHFG